MKPGKILNNQKKKLENLHIGKQIKKVKPKKRVKQIILWTSLSIVSTTIILAILLYIFPFIPFNPGPIAKAQAYAISARKIATKAIFRRDAQISGNTAEEIVESIIKARTKNNYLYTGGHYTDFYIRNLGTFANKLVEPESATNADDWLERVKLMTRSTEVALSVFESYNEITTTIVQLENGKYVPTNIYVKPADSLPSLLKILDQLRNINQKNTAFPLTETQKNELVTIAAQANNMIHKYEKFLKDQSNLYVNTLTDPKTKLIKTNITLSGIKDSWIRKSSLYDNVMLWAVYYYNAKLNLQPDWINNANQVKTTLLIDRWDEEAGIFFDEVPEESCHPHKKTKCLPYFSADNLIAFEMGMLNPYDQHDREYLNKIISYIQNNNLDKPFPLKATEVRFPSKEHLVVRLVVPNYTGTTIWSYWGMVYIDLLNTIGIIENNNEYKSTAKSELQVYTEKIIRYKGFPELYHPNGKQYRIPFYRSVNDMVWGIYYLYLDNKINQAYLPQPQVLQDVR